MKSLHVALLLFCLLGEQGSTLAFFKATHQLPPNRHWLRFEFNGGETRIKLHLGHLRDLARMNWEHADQILGEINLLPRTSNPLLAVWLLVKSARLEAEAIEQHNNLIRGIALSLTQTEQDKIWQEGNRSKEIKDKAVQVYENIYHTLTGDEKLLQLLAMTDPDSYSYKAMVEARANDIERDWLDYTALEQLLRRHAPELTNNSRIEWQDIEKLKNKISKEIGLPTPTPVDASTNLAKVRSNVDSHRLSRSAAEKRSESLYYLATASELLSLKQLQHFYQLYGDLMQLRSLSKDDFPLTPALVLARES